MYLNWSIDISSICANIRIVYYLWTPLLHNINDINITLFFYDLHYERFVAFLIDLYIELLLQYYS